MAEKKVKFYSLRPDSLHTFKMRAWSLSGVSEWTDDIDIRTSGILPIQWPKNAVIVAKPLFFFRCIRVTWTPLLDFSLRFSHYVLFRKDTTASDGNTNPTDAELLQSGQDIVDGNLSNWRTYPYFVKETGKFPGHTDQVKLDASDDTDDGIVEEKEYHYWVWAVDINGQTSYMDYIGDGQGYLGPDNAEFGIPSTPTVLSDEMTTEIHSRNSWWCNVNLVWECIDGAEGYWIQTKETAGFFWSLPYWVEHDSENIDPLYPNRQSTMLNNFLCDTSYDFKIKAVNVPLFLVSPWSEIKDYTTDPDPYPPNEIMNVSSNRLRQNLFFKGEYIKLTWDWPIGAIILQQIEYFRIYKFVGSITQAETYVHSINLAEGSASKPDPYLEAQKFGGTHFIDDEIIKPEDVEEGGGTQSFFWNGEYGTHTAADLRTAYIDEDLTTEVGTYITNAFVNSAHAYDGTYSLDCYQQGSRLAWYTHDLNGDEGYISLRWYPIDSIHTQTLCRIFAATQGVNQNGVVIEMRSGKLWLQHRGATVFKETEYTKVWSNDDRNKWHHLEARWKKSSDILQVRVNETDWVDSTDPDPLTSFDATVSGVSIGPSALQPSASTRQRYDKLIISPNFVDLVPAYYHYWVTAVDEGELESVATMPEVVIDKPQDEDVHGEEGTGESYDMVSFVPPEAPELVSPLTSDDPGFNMILILFWELYTVKMTWKEVSEATYYQVKIRMKPPGGYDWGPWMYTARIEEAYADVDENNNPFFVYPAPLQKHTVIEWAAIAGNLAGKTESDTSGEIEVLWDTEPPVKPKTPVGRCYGIYNLFGENLWAAVWLRWEPNPPYQGVTRYAIFEDGIEIATVPHFDPMAHFKMEHSFLRFGAESADSHEYRIRAIGADDVPSEVSDPVTIDYQEWWVM